MIVYQSVNDDKEHTKNQTSWTFQKKTWVGPKTQNGEKPSQSLGPEFALPRTTKMLKILRYTYKKNGQILSQRNFWISGQIGKS